MSLIDKKLGQIKVKDQVILYECKESEIANLIIQDKNIPYALRAGQYMIAIPQAKVAHFSEAMLRHSIII
ncbi:hypothetical protein OAO18_06815 [Francisellaceae bacterium]|nr:hypothetical protein [Francisellaceae bacterium]